MQGDVFHPAEGGVDLLGIESYRQQFIDDVAFGQKVAVFHDVLGDDAYDCQNPLSQEISRR
jgi:hypothetical protein